MKRRKTFRKPSWSPVMALRRLWLAIEHVRTGGETTKRRATKRAQRTPSRCPTCRREFSHSADYRDHIHPGTAP